MTVTCNPELCDRCGTCISVCPSIALLLLTDRLVVDESKCTGCSRCVKVCPWAALSTGRS